MADPRMAVQRLLDKWGAEPPEDYTRDMVRVMAELLMDAEVSALTGAERYERNQERTTYRNGYRERAWDTRVGTIGLRVPELRQGSYFPTLLDPRRRAEQAMVAVIQEAYVNGVSTRKVDRLVKSLGMDGISKSQVSRLCEQLDEAVTAWRTRPLTEPIVYLWLDATFPKVRMNDRVSSMAAVVAMGVTATGRRVILGVDVGQAESGAFWLDFLRSLVARGLTGVQLVMSDAHEGLKGAIAAVLAGAAWQRCRVHFMRNVLARVKKADTTAVMDLIRSIFVQPDEAQCRAQLRTVTDRLRGWYPVVADMLEEAEADLLAFATFPKVHWVKIWSTNPLERLNREIRRRIDVVGIFPNQKATIRLIGALLMEQDEEWATGKRYMSPQSMPSVARAEATPSQ